MTHDRVQIAKRLHERTLTTCLRLGCSARSNAAPISARCSDFRGYF